MGRGEQGDFHLTLSEWGGDGLFPARTAVPKPKHALSKMQYFSMSPELSLI
jgi:hypothetical protein